jgi:plasmid stability protein
LEEEAKELLRAAIARDTLPPQESLTAVAGRLFGSAGGVDLELPPRTRGPERDPPDFSSPEYDPPTDR